MPRLFTGIDIPEDVRRSLSQLRGGLPGARWSNPDNYHLTLRFIGDIERHVAQEVVHALSRVDRRAFTLQLQGVGAFGGNKPHTLWAGVQPSPALMALQDEHERVLMRLGLPPDRRKFQPHVTIARLRGLAARGVARYLDLFGDFQAPLINVDSFELFSAREFEGGGPYIVEESYPLLGASNRYEEEALEWPSV